MKKRILLLFLLLVPFWISGCSFYQEKEPVNKNDKIYKIDKHILGKTFIRTYHIYHIADSRSENYVYITIRAYNQEDIDTVLVEKSLFPSLEINKDYEFTFKVTNEDIEESIQSIFKNTEIVQIQETTKEGEEQINEEIEGD